MHLAEYWPVRGRGEALAGPPTRVTGQILEGHLLDLGRALVKFLPPAGGPWNRTPADRLAWNAWLGAKIAVLTPEVKDAVSKVTVLYGRLAEQFGSDAPALAAKNFCAFPTLYAEACRPWQHPHGRPMPEIDPGDIRALEWSAVKLMRASGWEPDGPAPQPAPETQPEPLPKPHWDGETRTLFLGGVGIKKYGRQPAKNQIDLLEAFERDGWARSIADPFKDYDTLKQTCKDLNRSLPEGTILFHLEGTGEGVYWAVAAVPKLPPSSP
jgi:hypothetical protein